jgi:hypothetical protein
MHDTFSIRITVLDIILKNRHAYVLELTYSRVKKGVLNATEVSCFLS